MDYDAFWKSDWITKEDADLIYHNKKNCLTCAILSCYARPGDRVMITALFVVTNEVTCELDYADFLEIL